MSVKKKSKSSQKNGEKVVAAANKKKPLVENKKANFVYNLVFYIAILAGLILFIVSQSIASSTLLFVSFGVLGLGIVLLVQKHVYKQSSSVNKPETSKSDDSIQLRRRQ